MVDGEKLPSENKRRSVRLMLEHLVDRGVDPAEVLDIIKPTKLHDLPGQLAEADEVKAAFLSKFPDADVDRYFLDTPFVVQDRTWVLSKMWGRNTRDTLSALHDRFPDLGVSWAEEG